uniref:PDZ domain-containing protein n=2 Tax=Oryza barthii TaxID=65489 RepID=A0A0D3GWA1_9ORYZ
MAAQESPPPFAAAAAATRASGDMASPPSPGEGGQSHTSERNPEKIQDQLAASSSSSAAAAKKRKSSETTTAGSTTLASRPLPPRYPPYPTLPPGTRPTRKYLDSVLDWAKERRRIAKLSKKDIPTLRDLPMDPITADAVVTSQDKAMVLRVARSVVSVSSTMPGPVPKKRKSNETTTAGSTTLASRPLPLRYPPYPTLPPGTRPTSTKYLDPVLDRKYLDSVLEWAKERRRIAKLSKKDIPTLRDDPITADAVVTSQDKAMVLRVARSVVSVSSTMPDGGGLISRCTGVVIGWDGANKRAKILTAASVVCDFNGELHNPALKLSVSMPNNTTTEGRLLFYNVHYGIALLEVMGDYKLEVPSFGSGTNYGQVIFALGRGENMSLMVSHGTISWTDYPVLLRNHNMFLSCDIPEGGSGGPVVDHDGNMIGIAFEENPGPVVISIKTIMTCMEMWDQFSRVARPLLGMQLKSVELLDVSIQEELCRDYNITSGFIVSQVLVDSTAEKLGIRRGDVIVFQDIDCSTLSQLEDHLLSLGWGYLKGMHLTVDLKVEVHNLFDSYRESITFPVQFTDASKQVN